MKILLLLILIINGHSNSELNSKVDTFLKQKLDGYSKYSFTILNEPKNYKAIHIIDNRNISIERPIVYLPVEVVNENKSYRSYVSIKIAAYKKVLVANRKIDKGEILTNSDFNTVEENIFKLRGNPVLTLNEDSLIAKTYLTEGTVLIKEIVDRLPIIRRGDKITAFVKAGNVVISTDAFAKQDGAKNDIISIVSKAHKMYKAEVKSKNEVNIIE